MRLSRPIVLAALMAVTLLVIGGAGTALAAPPNDNFASATEITSLPFGPDTVDTTEATTEPFETTPACDSSTKSVWYSFTPSTSGPVVIDTAGSSYTVGGAVLTGSPGSFSTVTCFVGQGSFAAEAGQTYRVALVDDFASGSGGTLRLSVTAPPPPTLSFASTGTLGVLGSSASVPVTYTCSPANSTIFEATLLQHRGKRLIRLNTIISDPATCDGLPHSTTAIFQNFGPFALTKGKATITPLIGWVVAVNVGPQQIRLRK